MNICLTLVIREIPIKITMTHHFITTMMTKIKKTATLTHCWSECKMLQPLWRTFWQFHAILNMELSHSSVIPFLHICAAISMETCIHTQIYTWSVPRSIVCNNQKKWKQSKCTPTNEWMDKMWYIHIMLYCSAIKGIKYWCITANTANPCKYCARWNNLVTYFYSIYIKCLESIIS